MEKLTTESLKQLMAIEPAETVVTLYVPMHTTGSPPHLSENQIRYKNLVTAACKELQNIPGTETLQQQLSNHLESVQANVHFFENQTPGLLVCADASSIRLYNLPIDTEEYVAVDTQFHLAPVMGLMADSVEYYVLAVAQHAPALYKGDMYGLKPTAIQLPATLAEGLNLDETNQKSEQSQSAGGSSLNTNGFNGRGGARDPGEEDRMRFFRMIDNIVMHKADRSLPLILAGIDAETAEYRSHSKYPTILTQTIAGNHSGNKGAELHDQSYAILHDEIISPKRADAIKHFEQLKGTQPKRTAGDAQAIASAAEQGRVETLLLRMTKTTHDTVRDTAAAASQITFPDKALSSALNALAIKVASMSGRVVNLDAAQMPGGTAAAATLRF